MELQVLNGINVSKEGVSTLISQMKESFFSGEVDILQSLSKMEILKQSLEEFKKDPDVRDCVLREVDKYGKEAIICGVKIKQIESGVKYDFESTGDPKIFDLLRNEKQIKESVKERTNFLKSLPTEGITELDENTGEVNRIYPPSKSSTTTFSITLPK